MKRGSKRRWALILLLSSGLALRPGAAPAADIKAEEIRTAITRHVESNMPWPPGTVRLNFPAGLPDLVVPGEQARFELQSRRDEGYAGDTAFTVKCYSGNTLVKEENVRVGLEVLQDVVVAAKALTRNKEITAEDVRLVRKWVKRPLMNAISVPAEVIGKVVTANLRSDSEITRNLIREPLLVKRGSMVRLVLDDGCLNVTTIGVSEEDGIANALIKVKNLSSNKTIYGRVASNSLVRVEF